MFKKLHVRVHFLFVIYIRVPLCHGQGSTCPVLDTCVHMSCCLACRVVELPYVHSFGATKLALNWCVC
jgi:hypothetical protein